MTWTSPTSSRCAKVYPAPPPHARFGDRPSWLDRIPADRPVLFIARGISMYLTGDGGIALLRRVVDHTSRPGVAGSTSSAESAIRSQKTQALVRKPGRWPDYGRSAHPDDVLSQVPEYACASPRRRSSVPARFSWSPPAIAQPNGRRPGAGAAQGAAVPRLRVRADRLAPPHDDQAATKEPR